MARHDTTYLFIYFRQMSHGMSRHLHRRQLRGMDAIMWIDNLSAKYGLQKAYSKVSDSGRIINTFKVKQADLLMRIHFEYVLSETGVVEDKFAISK